VLRLLTVNRPFDPRSEFDASPAYGYGDSAMDELLTSDFAVAEKDRAFRANRS
jgi:hypothetical protein